MANSLIRDIIKYSTLILCLINVVLAAYFLIDGLLNKSRNNEQVVYLVLMIIIFLVGAYATHVEDFLYLVIFGVVIVVGLAVNFLIKYESATLGRGSMVVLAVLVFLFALIIKRGNI